MARYVFHLVTIACLSLSCGALQQKRTERYQTYPPGQEPRVQLPPCQQQEQCPPCPCPCPTPTPTPKPTPCPPCPTPNPTPGPTPNPDPTPDPDEPPTPAPDPDGIHKRRAAGIDDIYGVKVPVSESWSVDAGVFYHNGSSVNLRGLNWFGFEGGDLTVHGLWVGRTAGDFISQVSSLGFNALRIPIAPQVFEPGHTSPWGKPTPIENLKNVLWESQRYGVNVLIDLHNCGYRAGLVGDPAKCSGATLEDWYVTLEKIAFLAKDYPNLLGIDLFNEPWGLSWGQWQVLSSEAGRRILKVNPKILVFVEGVSNVGTEVGGYWTFWGENLVEAGRNLPSIPRSRLVLSPHVYGPSVAWQDYFGDKDFPNNMEKIWDIHFGYLFGGDVTLSVGEFGGRYTDKDRLWQDAAVTYFKKKGVKNFFYWSLNPNSGDTGGLLQDDWRTVNEDKLKLLKRLF